MKHYSHSDRLARGAAAALAAMLILGVAPLKAASLSPALDILSAEYAMAKSGLSGTDIYFSREDFAEHLGVESVESITITSLPDLTLGHLQLGNRYVEVGQVILEKNLDALKFVPYRDEELQAVFHFTHGSDTSANSYACSIYALNSVNTAPTVKLSNTLPTAFPSEITVYSGVTHLGTIHATDAENDAMIFEIVRSPSHGELRLTDRSIGYYEYTADADYAGPDSFTVRVTDQYGNRSAEAKILLRASKPDSSEVFSDMETHWANAAVISCVRAGIVAAPKDAECFYPDEAVSRAEFLSLAMNAAGYSGFYTTSTGFADDAQIPEPYKGCVAAAEALGVIDGIVTDGQLLFYPNHQITRSEAAVIVSRLLGMNTLDSVAVFADDAVPAWASGAMYNLRNAGILRGSGTSIDAYAPLTRAAAAQLAASVLSYALD